CELLGFPHTTREGLQSLALLRSHGFSVVLNTGRSAEHIRNYCRDYSLPGGIGEYGSVFVDAVRGRETPLIDPAAAQQLARFRETLLQARGVYIDPGYEYSIRAYRYE